MTRAMFRTLPFSYSDSARRAIIKTGLNALGNRKEKFLIVGTGRNGSSLLCAILANAGADFGVPVREEWDRAKGAFEHPAVHAAYKWYTRADKIKKSLVPERFGYAYCLRKCDALSEKLFKEADFVKSSRLIRLVERMIHAPGRDIRIVGIYRNFSDYLMSRYKKFGGSFDRWREEWLDVNATLLMQSKIYPGVLISYEELLDPGADRWAKNLSLLTGLEEKTLLTKRNRIVDKSLSQRPLDNTFEDDETQALYRKLSASNPYLP